MLLSPHQLGRIEQHLRYDNWLRNDDLLAELKDHYVEVITNQLNQGVSFEQALKAVTDEFGGQKGLRTLEVSTNAAIYSRSVIAIRKVILAYSRPYRLAGIGMLLLLIYCSSTLPYHYIHPYIAGILALAASLQFVRQGLLYISGKKRVQPFPLLLVRMLSLFLTFTFLRITDLALTWLPASLFTPPFQAVLTTAYVLLWFVLTEALFIKSRFTVQ